MDSGCSQGQKTKCTSKFQYIELYSGPVYLMENRYNPIIVQVYVSFMYGLFIPILFPIAFLGILNKYFVEKLTLTYYYR